jgi:hypothetical protein
MFLLQGYIHNRLNIMLSLDQFYCTFLVHLIEGKQSECYNLMFQIFEASLNLFL